MSYSRPDTGDPELDKRLIAEDFEMLLPKLQGTTDDGFPFWLDKLALIDQDRITAYLREHWDTLTPEKRLWAIVRLRALQDLWEG